MSPDTDPHSSQIAAVERPKGSPPIGTANAIFKHTRVNCRFQHTPYPIPVTDAWPRAA